MMSCCSVALRSVVVYAVSILLLSAVNGQVCTAPDTVGSLKHDGMTIEANQVYILTGYTVQCEGIVTTWEFCYKIQDNVHLAVFYPGIWRETINNGVFSLIQSNRVTFNPSVGSTFSCHNYTVPVADQFTTSSGSIVGLFSNDFVKLLHTNTNDSGITTYRVGGNPTSVNGGTDVNFNIAVRVHLLPKQGGWSEWTPVGQCSSLCSDGIRKFTRTCSRPAPKFGGEDCVGNSTYVASCGSPSCGNDLNKKHQQVWKLVALAAGPAAVVGFTAGLIVLLAILIRNRRKLKHLCYRGEQLPGGQHVREEIPLVHSGNGGPDGGDN